MEHILSALQISYLAERGTARGGPEYGLLNWELGQESHLPELKVILIAMASSFHSCTPLFHLYSTRVNHLKHKCGLSFRLRAYQCLLITYKVETPQRHVQGQPWPTYLYFTLYLCVLLQFSMFSHAPHITPCTILLPLPEVPFSPFFAWLVGFCLFLIVSCFRDNLRHFALKLPL